MAMAIYPADVKLSWDATEGAASYRVQMSSDLGVTWTAAPNDVTTTLYTWTGIAEDKLVLFKVCAVNAVKTNCTDWAGGWYDHRQKMASATGLGVE